MSTRLKIQCVTLVMLAFGCFIAQSTKAQESKLEQNRIPRAQAANFLNETPPELAKQIVHKVPKVPIIIDGARYEPHEITKFNGQPLHFVVDRKAQAEGVMYAFTSLQDSLNYIQQVEEANQPNSQEEATNGFGYENHCYYFEHYRFKGERLILNEFFVYPWVGEEWNDRISSVSTGTVFNIFLFEHINFEGSSFVVARNSWVPDLDLYGWNDRVSSIF